MRGWVLPPDKVSHVNISVNGTVAGTCLLGSETRLDLAIAYPSVLNSENGGFSTVIPIGDKEGVYEIGVFAVSLDGQEYALGNKRIVNSRETSDLPSRCSICLISRCNLACTMCPAHAESTRFLTEGTTIDQSLLGASLEGLRDFVSSMKWVALCGYGEPFLYSGIFEAIERVHEISPSIVIEITSNGTMFSERMIQKVLDSSLNQIDVSLDAGTKTAYERIRKGANFESVVEGTRRLVEARTQRNRKLPVVTTNFVLMRSNIQELSDYVRTAISMHADHISAVNPHGLYESDRNQVLYDLGDSSRELPSEFIPYVRDAKALARAANVNCFIPSFTPSRPRLDCAQHGRTNPCVDSNGDVYPCCVLEALGNERGSRVKAMGNIRYDTLQQIWNSPRYEAFRKAFYAGEVPDQYCTECPCYYNL